MKIAVCISGQLRTIRWVYPEIRRFFGNDVDIFCHTYDHNDYYDIHGKTSYSFNETDISYLLHTNPEHIKIDSQDIVYDAARKRGCNSGNINLYSMWNSFAESVKLMVHQESINNFKYDLVVKTRYDMVYGRRMNFLDIFDGITEPMVRFILSDKGLYSVDKMRKIINLHEHQLFFSDEFFYGSRDEIVKIASTIFDYSNPISLATNVVIDRCFKYSINFKDVLSDNFFRVMKPGHVTYNLDKFYDSNYDYHASSDNLYPTDFDFI